MNSRNEENWAVGTSVWARFLSLEARFFISRKYKFVTIFWNKFWRKNSESLQKLSLWVIRPYEETETIAKRGKMMDEFNSLSVEEILTSSELTNWFV